MNPASPPEHNTGAAPEVSLVIPCYREQNHLEANVAEVMATMAMTTLSYEIILVDDCSPDRTADIMRELEARHAPVVRCAFHETNKGRGGAVKTGMALARAPIAGFMDIDLEVHCRYIPSMVRLVREGADIACGYRIYTVQFSFDDIFRNILSVGYRWLVRKLLNLGVSDTEAGFKFFNLPRVAPLLELAQSQGWFFDTEIMALGVYRGFNVRELPMAYIRKADKRTTVRPVRDAWDSLVNLLKFRRNTRPGRIYRSARMYHAAMKMLYGNSYNERFARIADLVPQGASVLDVCCGDARLYDSYLKEKNVSYTGLDIAPALLEGATARGIDARLCDVLTMPIPVRADIAIIQGSLYQFIPRHELVLNKILAAARDKVIVTEAVENWSGSRNTLKHRIAVTATNPGTGPTPHRFSPQSLDEFLSGFPVIEKRPLCSGREMLYVIDASGISADYQS